MNRIALLVICAAATVAYSFPRPRLSALRAGVLILAGGQPINVDTGHASPSMFDIDGDGKRDLLVGQFDKGKVRVYRNIGSDAHPRFKDFRYLNAGGEPATVPYG